MSGLSKQEALADSSFGHRVAEEESDNLNAYFVETDTWQRLIDGDLDIIYGPKGAGKSALYWLLASRDAELLDQNIILVAAENPRGAPAFQGILADPPASEAEFINLWKLYFLSLLSNAFDEFGVEGTACDELRSALEAEGLVRGKSNLGSVLSKVAAYVRRFIRIKAVEGSLTLEGVSGKILFHEPTVEEAKEGFVSVDNLLTLADSALRDYSKYQVWLILDRLDVAFAENSELEQNALRALFRVYLDLGAYESIFVKIFLRSDIWNRITSSGFREASHITRHVTIKWDAPSLLNLIVRRALFNQPIQNFYGESWENVQGSFKDQERFFYRLFPAQVDVGSNKPSTLDWMLSRTRDSSGQNAPRELIHLLAELRDHQMRRFERGEDDPDAESLFARATFKDALKDVSSVRLQQTLYAEYPDLRDTIEALRGEKAGQLPRTLARIWKTDSDGAIASAMQLVDVGFFEKRGTRERPEFWTPFLYRDALDLVQGMADK